MQRICKYPLLLRVRTRVPFFCLSFSQTSHSPLTRSLSLSRARCLSLSHSHAFFLPIFYFLSRTLTLRSLVLSLTHFAQELVSNTPKEHPDYSQLVDAQRKIEAIVAGINEKKKILEEQQALWNVQSQVEGVTDLMAPGRVLLREGNLLLHQPEYEPVLHKVRAEYQQNILLQDFTLSLAYCK